MSEALLSGESLYQEELYQVPPKVIFIIAQPWEDLSESDTATLTKLISALKLSIAGVQINSMKSFSLDALTAYNPNKVIALGASFESSTLLYENFLEGGVSIILSESISQLDDAKKKNLWLALRKMFSI